MVKLTNPRPARRAGPGKTYQRIFAVIRRIPRGRVATYGQVADLAGLEGRARQVGYALHHSPPGLPWHRVINAQGTISARAGSDWGELQRHLLEAEGIEFDLEGRCDLKRFRWRSSKFEVRTKK